MQPQSTPRNGNGKSLLCIFYLKNAWKGLELLYMVEILPEYQVRNLMCANTAITAFLYLTKFAQHSIFIKICRILQESVHFGFSNISLFWPSFLSLFKKGKLCKFVSIFMYIAPNMHIPKCNFARMIHFIGTTARQKSIKV